ncbi:ferredoxin [Catenulispora rubra]|uniref:ferredoxin n=1 Tax=Catenulispora rubra TaxID=280293 RepID=UPI00189273F1|nr:ferredoxin [Catenulispora rubra]
MKVVVDEDRCRGHAVCCSLFPELFTLTDDGYASAVEPEVAAEHEEDVRNAVAQCPERAISVS